MIVREVKVTNKAGIHTRPASSIVKRASKYKSEFTIIKNNFPVNGKSIIGVMSLAASQGTKLVLKFDGPDEKDMADDLVALIENDFKEL